MILYFIRHGDPNYELDCLTDLGHIQAKKLAQVVKDFKINEAYFSPQGRATQTGNYCMEHFPNIKPVTIEWLRELEWGDLSGDAYSTASPWVKTENFLRVDNAYPAYDSWKTDPRIVNDRLVGDVERRIECFDLFMQDQGLSRKGQGYTILPGCDAQKSIAFFCHGGLSACLISYLLNIPFWQFITQFHIEMTGITRIDITGNPGDFAVAKLNYLDWYQHLV